MLCCLSSAAMAQYVETVHLKNGSMIRGVIIEQIPEKTLKRNSENHKRDSATK